MEAIYSICPAEDEMDAAKAMADSVCDVGSFERAVEKLFNKEHIVSRPHGCAVSAMPKMSQRTAEGSSKALSFPRRDSVHTGRPV